MWAECGFSYGQEARLDMRMNQEQALRFQSQVNTWPYEDLVHIIYRYGEEKFAAVLHVLLKKDVLSDLSRQRLN